MGEITGPIFAALAITEPTHGHPLRGCWEQCIDKHRNENSWV